MNNLKHFNIISGLVLGRLYQEFPLPTTISCFDITIERLFDSTSHNTVSDPSEDDILRDMKTGPQMSNEEIEENKKESEAINKLFNPTMNWLKSNNYVSFDHGANGECENAILLDKALSALSLEPEALKPSIGESLVDAVSKGAKDGIAEFGKKAICEYGPLLLGKLLLGVIT